MDPIFHTRDEIVEFSDEKALKVATEIDFACFLDKNDPDAAYESVTNLEFDKIVFDDFIARYIATESISTAWGKLINYEKEIKMAGNAMAKEAGEGINLEPGTKGFTTSAPRKKDGQYYTRATLAFSDGQAIRILFYNPDKPGDKPKYPTNQVSFQIFLNKKDITSHLIKGGGQDYGPRKFGKIIGKLLKKNSAKFLAKNKQIQAQKAEMEAIDKEMTQLDKDILAKSNVVAQFKEKGVFLKKQREDLKKKSEEAVDKKFMEAKAKRLGAEKVEAEKRRKTSIESAKQEAYKLGEHAFNEGISDPKLHELLSNYKLSMYGDDDLIKMVDEEWQKGWEAAKARSEIKTGGEVQTTEPREDLKQLLAKEYAQLKSSGDVPSFDLGIRVAKKKGGLAGKVTLDLKKADVSTVEELNGLKGKIEDIVKSHTDNYSLSSEKVDLDLQRDKLLETDAEIQALGKANITSIGAENIYVEKGGRGYYIKLYDTEKYQEGPYDFSNEVVFDDGTAEPPPPEQTEDTTIKPSEIPPEEAPSIGREIGQDYKDRNDITKPVTHKIDDKTVSAIEQRGYIISAYLRNGNWVNLPTESGTLISEDKLKTAIDKSETAYQTADDILTGKYDDPDRVDQLLDEIAEVIEDEAKLNQIADYLTNLLAKKFAAPTPETV